MHDCKDHVLKFETLAILANDLLKVNNATNTCLFTLYVSCFLMIYKNIHNVLNINSIIPIELQSTEK